jgi:small subunit ribosomal protein S7
VIVVDDKETPQETPQDPPAEAPAPAPAPEAPPAPPEAEEPKEAKPKTKEGKQKASEDKPKEEKPEKAPSPLGGVLLFGRFDVSEVRIDDAGIARYIDISPVAVPHTGGKHSSKAFGKAKMSIVERLINGMMRTEDFTGKKIKSYRAVEDAFILIEEKTKNNPLQLLVDALQNAAPREEVTRLQYGGISVPKAVDVAPARRLDLALRHLCQGALESSHKSKKPIGECLADEIIAAAKGDVNCHSVARKEEIERVSASAR